MSGMLVNKSIAASFIRSFFRNVFSFASNSKLFDYSIEPFFRGKRINFIPFLFTSTFSTIQKGILKTTHRKHLQGLIDKSRIFVEKGRILMGCIDETGLLDENEVFIKCDNVLIMRDEELNEEEEEEEEDKDEDNQSPVYTILKGKIAVAKNPCMHPGDIRVLNAVDKPQLRHLVNCVVFPSKGIRKLDFILSLWRIYLKQSIFHL